jgi:hypothetical protein
MQVPLSKEDGWLYSSSLFSISHNNNNTKTQQQQQQQSIADYQKGNTHLECRFARDVLSASPMRLGSLSIFDHRILHRGTPNRHATQRRPVAFLNWAQKWFRDPVTYARPLPPDFATTFVDSALRNSLSRVASQQFVTHALRNVSKFVNVDAFDYASHHD